MTDDGAKLIANALMEIARQMKIRNLLDLHSATIIQDTKDYVNTRNSYGDTTRTPKQPERIKYEKLVRDMLLTKLGEF